MPKYMLFSLLSLAIAVHLLVANTNAQDATVTSLLEKLSDIDNDVHANAATELRELLASDAGARTNNRGRLYWEERLSKVKPGMTHDEVQQLLPPADEGVAESWSGGSGYKQWRLDDYWNITVHYNYPDSVHEMRPTLRRHAREVWVDPPADFTGTWTTYHINGQKAREAEYKNGKRNGAVTVYHDNGRKAYEQHYVDDVCTGTDCGWYPSGVRSYEGNYANGKRDGVWVHWSEDGRFQSREQLLAGENHGVRTSWHENGQKRYESTYKNGKKHGPDQAWEPDGKLLWSRVYHHGELAE